MGAAVLWRRLLAECLGTALLVTAVIGSGIMAATLSPHDVGLQLLENSAATVLALGVLILILGPVSGAHFNPAVSAADWFLGRRSGTGLSTAEFVAYATAQVVGSVGGCILANLMFAKPAVTWSTTQRSGSHLWLGEAVATAGLILLIFALARAGRASVTPAAVAAYIAAACWFTSSTSFANPAVTFGRAFSDTFAGIAPASVPAFVLAQVAGVAVGLALLLALYPAVPPRGVRAGDGESSPLTVEHAAMRSPLVWFVLSHVPTSRQIRAVAAGRVR
jgi:glycerol uptake facilitator-like aquaporin